MIKNKNDKIAVPTNDGETIFPKMLGQAHYFYIYQTTPNSQLELVEKRENPFEKTLQRGKTFDVYDVIKDCAIIISARIGKKGIDRLKDRGVVLLFRNGQIEGNLKQLAANEFKPE